LIYEKLDTSLRRGIGEKGRFYGDVSLFRRRHQTLNRAVGSLDRFMMLNNVAGFLCHIANIIFILYSLIFYAESTSSCISTAANLVWLAINVKGLLFSGSFGVIVNHMVRRLRFCVNVSICFKYACISAALIG